jgi:hypothetical protein
MSQKPLQKRLLICVEDDREPFLHRFSVASTLKGFAIRCKRLNLFQPFLSLDKRFENYPFWCFEQLKAPKRKGTINHVEIIIPFARLMTTSVASYFPTGQRSS